MTTHNAFSLRLDVLKRRAKQRLKALKHSDSQEWQQVRAHHPKAMALNTDNIRLADIQLVIARELGLPSWAQLKVHTDQLDYHRQQIAHKVAPLDNDQRTLHVRCGHDIQHRLTEAGFTGDFLPYIDPFCLGPLDRDPRRCEALRARFVRQHLLTAMGDTTTTEAMLLADGQQKRAQLLDSTYERLVLWVEHDNYDQLMMVRVLAEWCARMVPSGADQKPQPVLELIEVNRFPGQDRFIGLGQLPAEGLRALWQSRRPVSEAMMTTASRVWDALCDESPMSLVRLLSSSGQWAQLPNLAAVLRRHLQELPHQNSGLGLTQWLALEALAAEGDALPGQTGDSKLIQDKEHHTGVPFTTLFQRYQALEPLPFLGDVMLWAVIKPLLVGDNALVQRVSIAESNPDSANNVDNTGQQPLTESDWMRHKLALTALGWQVVRYRQTASWGEYAVGGIPVRPDRAWIWDHQNLSTLTLKSG
ncbi:DUF1835 domain-containing protein [Photobacterium ganghwense]|uniref:DUF1835 domain-containing protein n=1 Tax=Photobacterium ganghwense TaxID=320778 RepID=UPI001C2D2BB2|nr:DUF1835 domain-containing protein [Photobacterium ganghwense]MBV1842169.1 DUF1835 domain-containing protein [Photobacterium ganghwense]